MTKRYRVTRKPPMTVRDDGDERQFILTEPPFGAPPGATFSRVKVDITKFAERLFAMDDDAIDGRNGLARLVTDEDIAAIVATQQLAAWFATVWGQGGNTAARREVAMYREIVSRLDWLKNEMVGLRKASEDGIEDAPA